VGEVGAALENLTAGHRPLARASKGDARRALCGGSRAWPPASNFERSGENLRFDATSQPVGALRRRAAAGVSTLRGPNIVVVGLPVEYRVVLEAIADGAAAHLSGWKRATVSRASRPEE